MLKIVCKNANVGSHLCHQQSISYKNKKGDVNMPYIAIKSFPKDKEMKEEVVEKINEIVLEVMGCSQEAVTISYEEIIPEEWEDKVIKVDIEANQDKMMIKSGKRYYEVD